MGSKLTLHGYWRSSAAYRVRIALNLKQVEYDQHAVHLVRDGGEQHLPSYHALNPQHLVPTLVHGERLVHQSLAIIEYLDEAVAPTPPLLPPDARQRARVRALAQLVACDIHPLNNLRVMQYLQSELGVDAPARERWTRHWMHEGFDAFEALLLADPSTGTYCHGDTPTLADICLVPQVYNARRFGMDMTAWPTIARIDAQCRDLPAVQRALPENQPDAPPAG